MIETVLGNDKAAEKLWDENGGSWHKIIPKNKLIKACKWLLSMPLSIIIDFKGVKIGLSHTVPQQWDWDVHPNNKSEIVSSLLWDRNLFKKHKILESHGVDFSIHGHNSTQVPVWIGNLYHIDTSFYGRLTLCELSIVVEKFASLFLRK